MEKARFDLGIAKRFKEFRKKYIANNMSEASHVLNIGKSQISRIERAEEQVKIETIKIMVNKYGLNREWLLDNIGNPIKKDQTKKTGLMTSIEMGDRIDKLATELRIITINLDKAWAMIEAQAREIERLNKKNS